MEPPWSLSELSLVVRPTVAPPCLNKGNLHLLRSSFLFLPRPELYLTWWAHLSQSLFFPFFFFFIRVYLLYASTVLFSAPDPTAGHCRPTPPPTTPRHSQASLAQSLPVGSLFLSPGSWCAQGFVCALQEDNSAGISPSEGCLQRWRSSMQSAKARPEADCGSDHELLIAKFRFKLKKVGKNH